MNDIDLKKLRDIVNKRNTIDREKRELNYSSESLEYLKNTVEKRIRTTFIGSISKVEDYFGYLWGHGKDLKNCNEDEVEFRKYWEELRTKLLDFGNEQLRKSRQEVSQYDVKWNKYHLNMKIKEKND